MRNSYTLKSATDNKTYPVPLTSTDLVQTFYNVCANLVQLFTESVSAGGQFIHITTEPLERIFRRLLLALCREGWHRIVSVVDNPIKCAKTLDLIESFIRIFNHQPNKGPHKVHDLRMSSLEYSEHENTCPRQPSKRAFKKRSRLFTLEFGLGLSFQRLKRKYVSLARMSR